jgi:hypothetical protein
MDALAAWSELAGPRNARERAEHVANDLADWAMQESQRADEAEQLVLSLSAELADAQARAEEAEARLRLFGLDLA